MNARRTHTASTLAVFAVACLLGCAPQTPLHDEAEMLLGHGGTVEADLSAAASRYRQGDYAETSRLLRGILEDNTPYRVMPDVLYLLGEAELAGGDTSKAALSFHLLRENYPRKWSVLPGRMELDAIADAHRPVACGRASVAEVGPARTPGTGAGVAGSVNDSENARVTNMFYETDILQVLADVSAQTRIPIFAAKGVRGLVTAEFDDVPLEQCLSHLAVPLGLGYRWMDGYYLVGVTDPRDSGSMLLAATVEIRPRHLLAEEIARLLPPSYERYVRVDPAGGNILSLTAPPEVTSAFLRDVAAIDRPPRQVTIEALVVEVNSDVTREWGIDWEVLGSEGGATFRLAKLAPAMLDSSFIGMLTDTGLDGVDAVTNIGAAVRALEANGAANVRANPRLATLDGQEARIRVGTEAYYSLLSGSVSYAYYTLQKIATGITLRITPYVGESSDITTDIFVEVSDVRASGVNDLPVTSVREIETRACVGNGESILIGGLLSEFERTKENRIPLLGRIPVLGALFGHTTIEREQSEMLVLVTPHAMIDPMELAGLLE